MSGIPQATLTVCPSWDWEMETGRWSASTAAAGRTLDVPGESQPRVGIDTRAFISLDAPAGTAGEMMRTRVVEVESLYRSTLLRPSSLALHDGHRRFLRRACTRRDALRLVRSQLHCPNSNDLIDLDSSIDLSLASTTAFAATRCRPPNKPNPPTV